MVMTAYSKGTTAKSYYYDAYYDTTTVGTFPVSNRYLGGITSNHGDYHHPNPHAYTKLVWRGYVGSIKTYFGGKLSSSRTGAMPYSYSSRSVYLQSGADPNALNSAIQQAYEKLRGGIDLSVDLVQWKQVIQMASLHRRLARGLVSAASNLEPHVRKAEQAAAVLERGGLSARRAKRLARELNRSLNYLAQKRLEYVYGWRPTMGTIYDLALKAVTPDAPGMLVCVGRGRVLKRDTVMDTSISSSLPVKHFRSESTRARVVMYYNPTGDIIEQLSAITSLNPVSIFYELTPFSFVLDWAADVGGWIRSLETAFIHRNNFSGGYQTVTTRHAITSVMNGIEWHGVVGGTSFAEYYLRGDMIQTIFNRTMLNTAPFQVRPVKQFQLGAQRALNAIALAKSVLFRADRLLAR